MDLAAARGEFVTIVGPSGCGKTTLCSSWAASWRPRAGELTLRSADRAARVPSRGDRVPALALFPWRTVSGNIDYGLGEQGVRRRERARSRAAFEIVGLCGFEDRYPNELSGGMKQRVALARTLSSSPRSC